MIKRGRREVVVVAARGRWLADMQDRNRLADVGDEGVLKQAFEDNAPVSVWDRRVCVTALRAKGPPP